MTTDLRALLDRLDAFRAAGTPDEWQVMNENDIVTHAKQTGPGSYTHHGHLIVSMDDWRDHSDPQLGGGAEDAKLIAAAVNALPQLTTALRAVLDLADQWSGLGAAVAADEIRTAITTAIYDPEADR